MTTSAKIWLGAAIFITGLLVVLFVSGPHPVSIELPVLDTSNHLTLQHFDEGNEGRYTSPSYHSQPYNYQTLREKAVGQATIYMGKRDTLNLLFNILSVISVVASFSVTVIGANHGWYLSAEKIDKQLAKVKDQRTKKWIILLSAIAVLSTTLANRFSAYADKEQSKGSEIIGLVRTADAKVSGALDFKEVQNASENLELDLAKY